MAVTPKISSPLAKRQNTDVGDGERKSPPSTSVATSIASVEKTRKKMIIDVGSDSKKPAYNDLKKSPHSPKTRRLNGFNKTTVTTYAPGTLMQFASISDVAKASIAEAIRLHQQTCSKPFDQEPLKGTSQIVV